MRRREFISGLGSAVSAWPLVAGASPVLGQISGRIYRLGHLANTANSEALTRETTLPELAKLGFVEGRNLVFDGRVGERDALPGLARELLATGPDAVIAIGPAALVATGAVTRSVPIVAFGTDAVELGLAQTYARPGGNVTGVVILTSELEPKRLSILRDAVPDRRRVAALIGPAQKSISEPAMRKAAGGLGVELLVFTAAAPAEYPAAFAAMRAAGAEALVIGAAPEFFRDAQQLAALAIEARLPTVCEWAEMAHSGCLIGYGPNRAELRRRLANHVAQIFRGVAPGDIAIERPTVFESAINMRTAKALGLIIPQTTLAAADDVID